MSPMPPSIPVAEATEGRRRSASTRMTFWPPLAIVTARFSATVLFPSPADAEVTTIERIGRFTPANWRFVRSLRNASAPEPPRTEGGAPGRRPAVCSVIPAKSGRSVILRKSDSVRMLRSRTWRNTAAAIPAASPYKRPRPRSSFALGLDGSVGVVAWSTGLSRTGVGVPFVGRSRSATAVMRLAATALAMSALRRAEPSLASISMITVLRAVDVLILAAKASGVMPRLSLSMTGWSTVGFEVTSTYDWTRASAKTLPCCSSADVSEFCVETKRLVDAV
ncbi:hypothetical protein SRABI128_06399 [Microbacterium sp. Bi128]|nr:hypothetical protein SRABI128_06399 [Microbacterium sp. Bi128]